MKTYRILIVIFSFLIFLSCSKKVAKGLDTVSVYAIQSIWKNDICNQDFRGELINKFLEGTNAPRLDTSNVLECFGQPIHKRFLMSKQMVFIYPAHRSVTEGGRFYGSDLFCIVFDSKSVLKRTYMNFIADSDEAISYFFSSSLPEKSYQGIDDNEFLRRLSE